MKRLLILEDMPESQELLREIAESAFPGICADCAGDIASALPLLDREKYDLALIDLVLPDGMGIVVIQALARRFPHCMIVVASLFDDDDHLFPALHAGAHGYLLKDHPPELLVEKLRGISEGQPPLSPSVARRMLSHFHATQEDESRVASAVLTPREREVLMQLARGISIADIGMEMGISRHTVGDHVKNIYRKLNIASRAEAALQAKSLGLI